MITSVDAFDGLPFPRTDLAETAIRYVAGIEDPAIFNHSMRTYLYGRFLGEQQGLRPDRDYDDELLFLGCVLHDAGLSAEGDGDQPFDIDGADLAARFLTEQGGAGRPGRSGVGRDRPAPVLRGRRAQTSRDRAGDGRRRVRPRGPGALPAGYADRVHAVLPRLHLAPVLYDTIVGQALDKPHKARPFSMPGELVRQRTGEVWPTWEQLTLPGWNDYDGYEPRT